MSEIIEDRLAAMEHAIVTMQKSVDAITDETNKQTDETIHDKLEKNINALVEQLSSLTVAVQENATALRLLAPKTGLYMPWSEEHETLLTHKYVAKEVLLNVLWRALRVVDLFYTGWREVNKLLDTMPAYTVSRNLRFPEHGLYINIQNFDVYNQMQQLREYAYQGSADASLGGQTREFKNIVSTLQTLALSNVGNGRTVGMIHDRNSFEEEYKLKWMDQSSDPGKLTTRMISEDGKKEHFKGDGTSETISEDNNGKAAGVANNGSSDMASPGTDGATSEASND